MITGSAPINVEDASSLQCLSRTPDLVLSVPPGLLAGSSARTALLDFDPFMALAIAGQHRRR